jgi:iron complex transport system substrate-binding protein
MMIMRVSSARRLAVAALVLALGCAGCASAGSAASTGRTGTSSASQSGASQSGSGQGFPVTVRAANGAVRVASRPTAIMSLSPTATEMLYAIGAGSQVKTVDEFSDYPAQAPRTKLDGYQPNIEAIVADKPDLVLISNNIDNLEQRLASFSIPVLDLPAPANLNGEYAEFDQLGQATGHLAQAQHEVASLRAQVARIVAAAPHHTGPLTYYYELEQDYYSLTSATFVGSLLSLLGMKSIADKAKGAAAAGGYPQLSAEYIVRADPDYIILADTVCCHQSAATVTRRPGWATMTAVREHHVIALNDDIASRWGPRVVDLLQSALTGIRAGDR